MEYFDKLMDKVTVAQMTGTGALGTLLTVVLRPENLAIATGILTVVLLSLKIIHQARMTFRKRDE